MQITLKQDEIEAAIRNYVSGQVNIVEGNDVLIDLKAGRGPEGFTATIDIVPAGTKLPAPVEKVKTAKIGANKPGPGPVPATPVPETAQEAAGEPAVETAADAPATAETAEAATDGQQEGAGDAADAAPTGDKPKSLFAGLSKPRNN